MLTHITYGWWSLILEIYVIYLFCLFNNNNMKKLCIMCNVQCNVQAKRIRMSYNWNISYFAILNLICWQVFSWMYQNNSKQCIVMNESHETQLINWPNKMVLVSLIHVMWCDVVVNSDVSECCELTLLYFILLYCTLASHYVMEFLILEILIPYSWENYSLINEFCSLV